MIMLRIFAASLFSYSGDSSPRQQSVSKTVVWSDHLIRKIFDSRGQPERAMICQSVEGISSGDE